MSPENPLAWLGKQKEKRALTLCKGHMEKIVKVTDSMGNAVYSFCDGKKNFKKESKMVFDNERAADRKKAEVLEELSKGNFPPLSREMIIRLLMTVDDIADNARAAAMKLTFLKSEDISEDVKEGLKKLSDLAKEATVLLKESFSLLLEDPQKAVDKTGEVEKIEEKGDYFRAENLTPKLVKWADESQRPGTSYTLVEVEGNIEEVLDQAENSADVIREIAIRSM